jgi:hypothetical protein
VVSIESGVVEVLVPRAARFTVSFDGGLEDVDTGA